MLCWVFLGEYFLGNKVLGALEKLLEFLKSFSIMWIKIWGFNWNMWVICPFQVRTEENHSFCGFIHQEVHDTHRLVVKIVM